MEIFIEKFNDGCPKIVVEHTKEELLEYLGELQGENLLLEYENKKLKRQVRDLEMIINNGECDSDDN